MCWGKESTKSALYTMNHFPRWNNPQKGDIPFFFSYSRIAHKCQKSVICGKQFVELDHKALSNRGYAAASLR